MRGAKSAFRLRRARPVNPALESKECASLHDERTSIFLQFHAYSPLDFLKKCSILVSLPISAQTVRVLSQFRNLQFNMAKKSKTTKPKTAASKSLKTDFSNRRELFKSPDSYKSLVYGIVTVVILFVVGFSLVRLFANQPTGVVDDGAVSVERINEALQTGKGSSYAVQAGETLWSIAEDKYGSGFEWYRIAEANKITDVTQLEEGTALIIPGNETVAGEQSEVMEGSPVASTENVIEESSNAPEATVNQGVKIAGGSYVIKEGDDLWDIAVRAYGDGYKWVEIARANNLENPDLIHVDNTLKLPR